MSLKLINVILHGIAAIHLSYAAYKMYLSAIPPHILPIDTKFSGKVKYLTFWNVCIELAYFHFAFFNHFIPGYLDKRKKTLKKICDYWFLSIVFPTSFFVSFMFWALFFIDRELVMPKAVDQFFPSWLNHSVHTFIFAYSILELLTTHHKSLESVKKHYFGLWPVSILYLIWCNIVYFKTDMWVYPILAEMNWPCRIAFFTFCVAFFTIFLHVGYYLNNYVWKRKIQMKSREKAD